MAQGHWLPQKCSFLSTAILLVFLRLAATDENITYQPPDLLKKKQNSVLLLHPIRKPYSVNTVPSTHTERFTWNHIYRPKPAKISTQSCGTERWRIWGRYYVTNRQNVLLRLTCFSSLLTPTGQFMYYNITTTSLYGILSRIYEAWKSNVKKNPFV